MLLYVDDIFMMAPTTVIQNALAAIQECWKMTITGIIQRDDTVPDKPVAEINILGCRVSLGMNDTINLDQIGYIREKLCERGYEGSHGKTSLPDVIQQRLVPTPKEERQTPEFLEYRKRCQEECGVLIWIIGNTRPDLASALSMVASTAAFNPKEAFDMIKGIWQHIVFTHDLTLNFGKHEEQGMRIETDASFAPT